jgi:hypothetical protein
VKITVVKRVKEKRPKASGSKYSRTHVFSPRPGCSTYSSVIVGGVAAGALDSDRDGRFTYELEAVP